MDVYEAALKQQRQRLDQSRVQLICAIGSHIGRIRKEVAAPEPVLTWWQRLQQWLDKEI